MNQEIEVKIQIESDQLKKLQSWLEKHATFVGELRHKEYYLDNPQSTFFFTAREDYKDALRYLRVRFTPQGDSVCYKDFYVDSETGKTTHCDEIESKVADGRAVLQLLAALGYTNKTLVEKKRKTYLFDDFEIVIDEVTNLGIFVEVELKEQVENVKAGTQLIFDFLKSVGITKFKKQERGYVSMLWNPDYDFGEQTEL
ncbi:class IV adenylate cyclase [Candidatus Babeliales bacterium]|nr:class IV adenylate cyclase [Candidatus Babeliales bacterium]